jgi:hypothetical protein
MSRQSDIGTGEGHGFLPFWSNFAAGRGMGANQRAEFACIAHADALVGDLQGRVVFAASRKLHALGELHDPRSPKFQRQIRDVGRAADSKLIHRDKEGRLHAGQPAFAPAD